MPQHAATHCNTLQHTATHRNTLQHSATQCNSLQNAADSCFIDTLQHTATHYNTLQHAATRCIMLHHAELRCNTLQHAAARCNTLQSAVAQTHYSDSVRLFLWSLVNYFEFEETWHVSILFLRSLLILVSETLCSTSSPILRCLVLRVLLVYIGLSWHVSLFKVSFDLSETLCSSSHLPF